MRQCFATSGKAVTRKTCHPKVSSPQDQPQAAGPCLIQSPVTCGRWVASAQLGGAAKPFQTQDLGKSASESKGTIVAISDISSRKAGQLFPFRRRPCSCGRSRPAAAAPLPRGSLRRWQEAAAAPGPAEALPHTEGKALVHPPDQNAPSTARGKHLQTVRTKKSPTGRQAPAPGRLPRPRHGGKSPRPAAAAPAASPLRVTVTARQRAAKGFPRFRSALAPSLV